MVEKLDSLVEQISQLTVAEAAKLVKALEETWGVSAAQVAVQQVAQAGGAAPASGAQQKTAFSAILKGIAADDKKLSVIKTLREIVGPSLSLGDAKSVVEKSSSEPYTVANEVPAEKVDEVIKKLEAAGGIVEKR